MLKGKAVKINKLTNNQKEKMYLIMTKYYENIKEQNFYADLGKKIEAILLCDANGEIHGFTTLAIFLYDKRTQLVFSGDTIVEKEYWGIHDLGETWLERAFSYAENFEGQTYWLLLSKGYKTYKYLHTFYNTFYPCVDKETPSEVQAVIDKFATEQFGNKYKNGVYAAGKDFLKEEFDDVSDAKLKNKHTSFFFEKNPNYKQGDELVCITELSLENLNRLGRRMLDK
ncbi:MAG: hypothetical protein FWB75_04570 [Oscillospiraceae bacterium]|nr:hypothetical protein [Oscillospiraceae bacterium]